MFRVLLFFKISLVILITNTAYSQPNISKTFTNLILHKTARDLPLLQVENKDKENVVLSDFSSKITLINFWATWCAPCKKEIPKLDKLAEKAGSQQLNIIAINIEKKPYSDVKKFLDDLEVKNFDTVFDRKLQIAKTLGLRGIPITLVVNQNSKEVARIIGDLDFERDEFVEWINSF